MAFLTAALNAVCLMLAWGTHCCW